ncbi:MAG: iron ABC transporter permease [Rectinema sp.]|nr:iron ABC transporter permease [Rectinema sp.]
MTRDGHASEYRAGALYSIALFMTQFSILPLLSFGWNAIARSPAEGILKGLQTLFARDSFTSALRVLGFTLIQALVSTGLAVLVGLPGAWLTARFRFPGRRLLRALAAIPFSMPPILVVLAFILFYGKQGAFHWLRTVISGRDVEYRGFLYSFAGLVFVHAFYNFPVVIHQVGAIWERIPRSREEAARTLGAGKLRAFITGTLPWLLPAIGQAAGIIFLYCFFSFTIVLVFGGRYSSTLEVEIYRALRYQADYRTVSLYALMETVVAAGSLWFMQRMSKTAHPITRDFGQSGELRKPIGLISWIIALYSVLILIFFIGPLISIAVEAFRVPLSMAGREIVSVGNFSKLTRGFQAPLLPAIFTTLAVSGSAALLATTAGLASAIFSLWSIRSGRGIQMRHWLHALQWAPMAVSPAIFAYGWLFLSPSGALRFPLIAAQALIAWPFVARSISASLQALDPRIHEAARTLGASPLKAFMSVELRTVAPSVASAAAFAFSITAGDVNVPLMLGLGEVETLPLLLYRLVAAYRFNEACAVGFILAMMTGLVFFLKEKVLDVI